jgi:hypothetical protein
MSAAAVRWRLDLAAELVRDPGNICDRQWAHAGESTACTGHWASSRAGCEPFRERRTA